MKKTRNLFVLAGLPPDTVFVLDKLCFKGMVTFANGSTVTEAAIEKAFSNNKSVVCSKDDYLGKLPESAIIVNVTNHILSQSRKDSTTIFLDNQNVAKQFEKIANDLNCDIGDHKSNSSGLNGTPTIQDCAYCRYLAGDVAMNERVLYKSKNFFVIPTLGQFITGYLLIIPFEHVMSNAELDIETLKEFETVLEDIEYLLRLTYHSHDVLVWENGSGKSGIGKAKDSIVHSHVHIAPSNLTFEDIESASGFPFEEITLDNLSRYKEHSYLLVRTSDHNLWEINNNPELYIPRQYVRQLLAQEYDIFSDEQWNWRTHPFREKMHITVAEIKSTIKSNWDILPERIKQNTSFLF